MNTIRIYETDSHARRLQARVLSCEESENGWLVELDRTIFYPTEAASPATWGTLGRRGRHGDVPARRDGAAPLHGGSAGPART